MFVAASFAFLVASFFSWNDRSFLSGTARAERSQSSQSHSQSHSQSQSQKKKKSGPDGIAATVTTDGALLLQQADPDANPVGQLAEDTKVRVSRQSVDGPDGTKFRRIKVGKRIGYISEIDIRIGDGPAPDDRPKSSGGKKLSKKEAAKEAKKKAARKKAMGDKREEMLFSRFVGVLIGTSEYKEGIDGVNASTNLIVFGLKITGPDLILSGPIVDFNLALHYGAPEYYQQLSATKPNGFVLLTDLLFVGPFAHSQDSMVYVAGGPMLAISKFSLVNSGRAMDLTSLNLGLSLALGGAIRLDKVALRLEAKYYIEKQSYKELQAAIQTQF
jgi:hypothetical protein